MNKELNVLDHIRQTWMPRVNSEWLIHSKTLKTSPGRAQVLGTPRGCQAPSSCCMHVKLPPPLSPSSSLQAGFSIDQVYMLARHGAGLILKYDKESFVQMQKQGTLTQIKRKAKRNKKRNKSTLKIPFWHYAINKILRTVWRVPKDTNPITATIEEFLLGPPLDDAVVFFNKWFTVPLKHRPGDDSVLPPPELPPPTFTVKYNDNYGSTGRGKVRKHKFLGTEAISKYVQPEFTHLFFKLMQKWDDDLRKKALSEDQSKKILGKTWYVYVPSYYVTPLLTT